MGIEGGSSGGGVGGGVGSGAGIGGGVGVAVGVGSFGGAEISLGARFGPSISGPEAYMPTIVNEGPVRGGFLEGFRPMNISDITTINKGGITAPSPLGEILFRPLSEPSIPVPGPTEVFMPKVEPMAMPTVTPLRVPPNVVEFPKPQVVISPALEPQIGMQTRTENRISTSPMVEATSAVLPQPAPIKQEVEEIVEEKVKKQEPEERMEESEEIEKQMYLEDRDASAQRRIEIKGAIVKARVEADRLGLKKIAGWMVAKFLPGEHEGNRSQVVRKTGPDGSYQETVEEINGAGELDSEEQAVKRFDKVVAEKKPVKFGKNGNPVGNTDIARVFKYRLIKPIQVHEEVVKRVIKKKVLVSQAPTSLAATEKKEIKVEPNLYELNPILAEVFQKAA